MKGKEEKERRKGERKGMEGRLEREEKERRKAEKGRNGRKVGK